MDSMKSFDNIVPKFDEGQEILIDYNGRVFWSLIVSRVPVYDAENVITQELIGFRYSFVDDRNEVVSMCTEGYITSLLWADPSAITHTISKQLDIISEEIGECQEEPSERDTQKALLKELLVEMFKEGEIEIKVDQRDRWERRYLVVEVEISGQSVYTHEEDIGSSGWSDT
jgi:hypothetical protein